MKVIAIFGEPGSGKSTLMLALFDKLGISKEYKSDFPLVPYHQKDNIYILGKYEEGEVFCGTDKMSMAVQPEAIKFLAKLPKDSIVIFEGDRLSTSSFLEHCQYNYDLDMIYLNTDKKTRELRYKERGSNQNETWLRGRESKVSNILSNLDLKFSISVFANENEENKKLIVDHIMQRLNNG